MNRGKIPVNDYEALTKQYDPVSLPKTRVAWNWPLSELKHRRCQAMTSRG